jgi:hypothetical protein
MYARHARPGGMALTGQTRESQYQKRVVLAALCALVATAVIRFSVGRHYPLWFDETWTGALSADRDFHTFYGDVLNDANGPLYYVASWLWATAFGVSNVSLRSLAAVFGLLAPLVALRAPLDRTTRWTWCAMLACWVQGLVYSQDARCYTLVLLLSVGSGIAFLRLLQAPSNGRAAWWCALSALAILTHYYAALPALLQGATYVSVHRPAALRSWPAALVLLPLLGWMALHGPRVLLYSRNDVAWYPLMTRDLAWYAFTWVWGRPKAILVLCLAVAAALARAPGPDPEQRAPWLLVLTALAATAFLLGFGALHRSFTERYLTSFIPGLLLAPVLVCCDPRRKFRPAPLVLIGAAFLGVFAWARRHEMPSQYVYGFEPASAWIAEAQPQQVVFFWDNPLAKIQAPASLARVGGFFFARAKQPLEVRPLAPPPNADPNDLMAAATSQPKVATLWIYDLNVHATAAQRWPPRPLAGQECRNFGWNVFACRPGDLLPAP